RPPTAQNWAVGCWGQFVGDGSWRAQNQTAKPASLYRAQLALRCGPQAGEDLNRREIPSARGDAPSIEALPKRINTTREVASTVRPVSLRTGLLVCDGRLLAGSRSGTAWWRGTVLPARAGENGTGVTRFVPGRGGPGFTDDLDVLTDLMRHS